MIKGERFCLNFLRINFPVSSELQNPSLWSIEAHAWCKIHNSSKIWHVFAHSCTIPHEIEYTMHIVYLESTRGLCPERSFSTWSKRKPFDTQTHIHSIFGQKHSCNRLTCQFLVNELKNKFSPYREAMPILQKSGFEKAFWRDSNLTGACFSGHI